MSTPTPRQTCAPETYPGFYGSSDEDALPPGYSPDINTSLHDAMGQLTHQTYTWRENNSYEYQSLGDIERYALVCREDTVLSEQAIHVYHAEYGASGNHNSVLVPTYDKSGKKPAVSIHTHPHDRNENILWNDEEKLEMLDDVLYIIMAYNEEHQAWSVYYRYNGMEGRYIADDGTMYFSSFEKIDYYKMIGG